MNEFKAGLLASESNDGLAPSHFNYVKQWLPRPLFCMGGGLRAVFPVTAAGPQRIYTVFPFKLVLNEHLKNKL